MVARRWLADGAAGEVGRPKGPPASYLRANLAYALKRPGLREGVLELCREMLATSGKPS
jgi:hypothetical protein